MLLTITVVSYPNPFKKPAHSKATYEAPITNVLPGILFIENKSSDVITNFSTLGIFSGIVGLPPTAIRICLAVISSYLPLTSVN